MEFNFQNILQQAGKIQQEMEKLKEEAKKKIITSESGGGLVNVKMNGEFKLLELKISKEIINPEDPDMLQDLIVAAINKATKEIENQMQNQFQNLSNILPKIPGLF